MSPAGQSELERLVGRLEREWEERVAGSPEAREARTALQLHRRKVHQLEEEVAAAEDWEVELEGRSRRLEESLKPHLLQFRDKLEKDEKISEDLINELEMEQTGLEAALQMVMPRVERAGQLRREQLVRLVETVVELRSRLLAAGGRDEGAATAHQLAARLLKQLGREAITWAGLADWEAAVLRGLVRQVNGVPAFVARIVDQLLADTGSRRPPEVAARGMQTEDVE
jgi:hypothetical protein